MAPPKTEGAARGTIRSSLLNGLVTFSVRAVPLPTEVATFLVDNTATIRKIHQGLHRHQNHSSAAGVGDEGSGEMDDDQRAAAAAAATKELQPEEFWAKLEKLLEKNGPMWRDVVDKIWASVRRRNRIKTGQLMPMVQEAGTHLADALESAMKLGEEGKDSSTANGAANWQPKDLDDAFDTGFQFSSLQGPMCAEPLHGMAFFVESVEISKEELEREGNRLRLTQVTSGIITSMREACRNGLLDWSPRLMLAMYSCDIQASSDPRRSLAPTRPYHIGRDERGHVFLYRRVRPPSHRVVWLRRRDPKKDLWRSSPQLVFAGFEVFDIDPFWVPRTEEEELEDLGEKGDRENVAKKYMDKVRKRKGLFVNQRIVEGEKQGHSSPTRPM
ncbi:hypothetical protein L7F22_018691 [Adiantum nelumboides]|nr:hypothetical protein [Adiantum nelumboides]